MFSFLIIMTRPPFAAHTPQWRRPAGESVHLWAGARPNWSRTVSLLRPLWRRHAIINGPSRQSRMLFIALMQLLSALRSPDLPVATTPSLASERIRSMSWGTPRLWLPLRPPNGAVRLLKTACCRLVPVVGQSMFVSRGAGRKISSSSVHDECPALRQVSYSRRTAAGGGLRARSA